MFKKVLLMTKLILLFALSTSWAVAPEYQYLYYSRHVDVKCGPCIFKFSLFDAPAGGTELWTEEGIELELKDKYVYHYLGSVVLLDLVDFSQKMWVQVEVKSDEEEDYEVLEGREELEMVPYGFYSEYSTYAVDSDTLDGKHATEFENAHAQLQTSIETETTTRTAAVGTLQAGIDNEAAERQSADMTLQNKINAEEAARYSADSDEAIARAVAAETLQAGIGAEADIRAGADTALQANIDTETAARTQADTAQQDIIDAEAAARASADATLQEALTTHTHDDIYSYLSGNITGSVRSSNVIFADTQVYIPGLSLMAKTDSEGKFSLLNVPVGSHQLAIERQGDAPPYIQENIAVSFKATTELGEIEICPCDIDLDGDFYGEGPLCLGPDCNDSDAAINPATVWYQDSDGDGHGDSGATLQQCDTPSNYVLVGDDCDDADANEYPNQTWYMDADGDGFGFGTATTQCESPGATFVIVGTDCDDADANEYPGQIWYVDADGDGFGDPDTATPTCENPGGYITNGEDCCDTDPQAYPESTHTSATPTACGGWDYNCNGVDEKVGGYIYFNLCSWDWTESECNPSGNKLYQADCGSLIMYDCSCKLKSLGEWCEFTSTCSDGVQQCR